MNEVSETYGVEDAHLEKVKANVRDELEMLRSIGDEGLREHVVLAWAVALCWNGFEAINDMPGSARPGAPEKGTQAQHMDGTARIAVGIKGAIEETLSDRMPFDDDMLIASALCHDLGKPVEYSVANRERWAKNRVLYGRPSVRHPAYGAHVALTVGLPEEVMHVAAAHAVEGNYVQRSLLAHIVQYADDAYWFTIENWDGWVDSGLRL
ncbi:HD domain-containing protein [Salana multivorans]|uniref:HD domain-containing protein n=1 Tax=Salana multivorans TaxID=120377 RepID=A0A3N2DD87_9MICO|nr:HD domain-containing protein [Salana multivorans]ROR97750.1 HD domain-containing protein [Salana multivorans]